MLEERPAITVDGLEIPGDAWTLEGFRRWFGGLGERAPRASFLAGRLHIEKTPQSYGHHGPLVDEVNGTLRLLARELDLGRHYGPPSWITREDVGLSTEPDGFLVAWDRFEDGRFRIDPARDHEAIGAPTMVFEAVSPSSTEKDLVELAGLYFKAGVEEYWIADARGKKLAFRILVRGPRAFRAQAPVRGWISSRVWGRSFKLRRTTDRVGNPDFVLDSRGR